MTQNCFFQMGLFIDNTKRNISLAQSHLLQDDAYHYLYQQIKDGVFENDRIYSLNTIANMLKMSKTPVRNALQKLVQDELLECLPSRGFRLKPITEQDISMLYQLRSAMEGYCCYNIALRYQETDDNAFLIPLIVNLDIQQKIIEKMGNAADFWKIDRIFHNLLLTQLPNKPMNRALDVYRDKIDVYALKSLERKGLLELTLKEHTAVYDAICKKDPVASQAAILHHLNTAVTKWSCTCNHVHQLNYKPVCDFPFDSRHE